MGRKLYGGSHRDFECDWGSRARDWEWSDGISDIEHVRSGIARVDGNAAKVVGASTG